MIQCIKEMALVCSIYVDDYRNLAAEHKLEAEVDQNREVDLFLVDPPYNLQRDRNDDHADYDAFKSSDMEERAKFVGDIMKQKAHAHGFCSTLRFVLWY